MRGIPSIPKKPAPISLKREPVLVSGPDSKPSTDTLLPQLLPAMRGTLEAVTPVTPGTAASSASRRSKKSRERSGEYPLSSGDTPNVAKLSMLKPRSTRVTFIKLFTKRPAATRSAIESAICAVASVARKRPADRAPDVRPD